MRRVLTALAITGASCLASSQPVNQAASNVDVSTLQVGDYYRPQGALVSGFPDATTPFVRAPCPALNTLANHGYIPRNGKNVTRAMLKQAIITVFNIDSTFAGVLASGVDPVVSLAYLGTHNLLEHDVSFAHADASYKQDPSSLDSVLWVDLAGRATNGQLGVKEISAAAKDRIARCKAKPTGCDFGVSKRLTMLGEAALILLGFGGKNGDSVRLDHAQSFFVDEKIPSDYKKPATPLTAFEAAGLIARIQANALW